VGDLLDTGSGVGALTLVQCFEGFEFLPHQGCRTCQPKATLWVGAYYQTRALKRLYNRWPVALSHPFRANGDFVIWEPKTLPWVGLFQAFGRKQPRLTSALKDWTPSDCRRATSEDRRGLQAHGIRQRISGAA
jgi:hypothetical protein